MKVGKTELRYRLRCLEDLTAMLLGSAGEPKPAAEGTTVPVMEALGFAEVEHNPKNNRMRAK